MEKANKKIIYEVAIVHHSFNDELERCGDAVYSRYHQQNADWYRSFSSRFNRILGFTGQTIDEFVTYVSALDLTMEQKRALVELRSEPVFKRLMGEAALRQKTELEGVLGSKIDPHGMTFADENGARVAVKTEQQLEEELEAHSSKLSELLNSNAITEGQYDDFNQSLDYIYGYYISRSKGEQLPFRKMTDAEYENIEQEAQENGISFFEQNSRTNRELRDNFDENQELQSQSMRK